MVKYNMTQDYSDIFPIKTATACASKWAWSTIWLNKGESASCHRNHPSTIDPNDFDNFHNLPKKIEDRKLMLEGKWPTGGCEYCQDIEKAGGFSDRQHNNDIGGYVPIELKTDLKAVHVSPKIVEIFAQNTCNLACLYCFEDLSSRIQTENKKFGHGFDIPIVPVVDQTASDDYYSKFLDWLDRNIKNLSRLHLLGGETYIQHNLMNDVLNIIERNPNPNLQLNIFSNFNAPEKYWNEYNQRFKDYYKSKNIGRLDLTCSIDCWGPEAEFVRNGLNLVQLEKNLDWASSQSEDWLYLNINQTISSMTIKTMPELIEKIKEYSKNRHIGHYFMLVENFPVQHPEIFDYSMWENDFERILNTMRKDTVEDQEAITRMIGIQKRLQHTCKQDTDKISRLHAYLDEMDRRRSTDWRSLFSYLIV
jgi:hypothetical protein